MARFSVIVAVHHEIIVEAEHEEQAETSALQLVNDVFDAFDTETITADECSVEEDVTTKESLCQSCGIHSMYGRK